MLAPSLRSASASRAVIARHSLGSGAGPVCTVARDGLTNGVQGDGVPAGAGLGRVRSCRDGCEHWHWRMRAWDFLTACWPVGTVARWRRKIGACARRVNVPRETFPRGLAIPGLTITFVRMHSLPDDMHSLPDDVAARRSQARRGTFHGLSGYRGRGCGRRGPPAPPAAARKRK